MGRVWDWVLGRETVERVEPLEGTSMSLYNSVIPDWWRENVNGTALYGTPSLSEKVWVANRCQQMNSQQIASMPLEFHGTDEPAWVSSPDPSWYPNGIADAIFSIVNQLYGYGFACLYTTDRYSNGFPRSWTVLDSSRVTIKLVDGSRAYKVGEETLDPRRIVQIDRNPGVGLHGTSALRAYAQAAWGLLAAGNQSLTVTQGGVPLFYLASQRKLTKEQAELLQTQWAEATSRRNGAPPIVPPEIEPKELSINPSDLALLETQEWTARTIATAYGVPSVLLNMALQGGLTYQNPAALGEMWWRFELRPTATRVANALSAQMLPRGQWVTFDAADTFAELTDLSDDDDPQLSQTAKASPAQQPGRLTAIGGTG
jgi:HK97 family phage portal protein